MATKQIPAAELKPGMTYVTHYGQRPVKSVGVEVEHGIAWFMWWWDRAPRQDGIDCGYGGVWADQASTHLVEVLA